MRFSVNTMNFFPDLPFPAKMEVIRRAGFDAVEILFPYYQPLDEIRSALDGNGLSVSIIDVNPGDLTKGDFNAAIDPSRRDDFRKNAAQALSYAEALKAPHVNCLAGISTLLKDVPAEKQMDTYRENLLYICDLFRDTDIDILIEPVSEGTMAGYIVNSVHAAAGLVRELDRKNLALQFDFFHVQMLHGNLVANMRKYSDMARYYQVANPPGRNEPGCGEIDYGYVLKELEKTGYTGYVGLEYNPSGPPERAFDWIGETGFR